jgi:hypothetical protein
MIRRLKISAAVAVAVLCLSACEAVDTLVDRVSDGLVVAHDRVAFARENICGLPEGLRKVVRAMVLAKTDGKVNTGILCEFATEPAGPPKPAVAPGSEPGKEAAAMVPFVDLARASQAVYSPDPAPRLRALFGSNAKVEAIAAGPHFCAVCTFAADKERVTVVVNRGTEKDFGDILTDMRAYPWYSRALGIHHRGFGSGAGALWDAGLGERIQGAADVKRPVILTGHSLGGALAACEAGLMIEKTGKAPVGLVTFGAPRVGLRVFGVADIQDRLDARGREAGKFYRVQFRHGDDVVTEVPTFLPGWRHAAGYLIKVGFGSGDGFRDHMAAKYVAAVGLWVTEARQKNVIEGV